MLPVGDGGLESCRKPDMMSVGDGGLGMSVDWPSNLGPSLGRTPDMKVLSISTIEALCLSPAFCVLGTFILT